MFPGELPYESCCSKMSLKKIPWTVSQNFHTKTCPFIIKPPTKPKKASTIQLSLRTVGTFSGWLFYRKPLRSCFSHKYDSLARMKTKKEIITKTDKNNFKRANLLVLFQIFHWEIMSLILSILQCITSLFSKEQTSSQDDCKYSLINLNVNILI